MWIQRPSRSQSCLSQSADLWQCILQCATNDTSSSNCMLMLEVKDIHFYRFISTSKHYRVAVLLCFLLGPVQKDVPWKIENRTMMHLQYILCNSYRCIQLGSSCWPLAFNNLEPVPYNMQPQLNEELLFDSVKYMLWDLLYEVLNVARLSGRSDQGKIPSGQDMQRYSWGKAPLSNWDAVRTICQISDIYMNHPAVRSWSQDASHHLHLFPLKSSLMVSTNLKISELGQMSCKRWPGWNHCGSIVLILGAMIHCDDL